MLSYWSLNSLFTCIPCWASEVWTTCSLVYHAELLKFEQPVPLYSMLSYWSLNNLFTCIPCWATEVWPTCSLVYLAELIKSEQPVHLYTMSSYWSLNNLFICTPCWDNEAWTICSLLYHAELLKFEQHVHLQCILCWPIEISKLNAAQSLWLSNKIDMNLVPGNFLSAGSSVHFKWSHASAFLCS